MPRLSELGEWGLIAALADRQKAHPDDWVGIGDDTAAGALTPGWQVLTTVDAMVEGIHFKREWTSPSDLGHKALAVNLSDIAAMGGIPRWAVVAISAPGDLDAEWVLAFYDGLGELAASTGTRLVGGDTTGSPGPIWLSVTVVGEVETPILRKGARPGDWVFATGPLGASAAGLWCMKNPGRVEASALDRVYVKASETAHRRPVPQLEAGRAIRESGCRVAMLDNSDGLARSARLLAEANGIDIRLEVADLPLTPATRAVAELAGVNPLQWALDGGEDYNLIGTASPADWARLEEALRSAHVQLFRLGDVIDGHGRAWVRGPDQQTHELTGVTGFQHF